MTKDEDSGGRGGANHSDEARDVGGDDALRARLSKLSKALDDRGNVVAPETIKVPNLARQSFGAANLGFRALVEFVSAIVVGTFIGWLIDSWAHTQPIFLIFFMLTGMAAGMVNIYRVASGPGKPGRE